LFTDKNIQGVVVRFDSARGLGEIEDGEGRRYPFHCTRIADGSRTILVGTKVEFVVVPGLPGCWEASGIRSCR
jgi:cold shock CspA family protein